VRIIVEGRQAAHPCVALHATGANDMAQVQAESRPRPASLQPQSRLARPWPRARRRTESNRSKVILPPFVGQHGSSPPYPSSRRVAIGRPPAAAQDTFGVDGHRLPRSEARREQPSRDPRADHNTCAAATRQCHCCEPRGRAFERMRRGPAAPVALPNLPCRAKTDGRSVRPLRPRR
jgi:hypothetical protein